MIECIRNIGECWSLVRLACNSHYKNWQNYEYVFFTSKTSHSTQVPNPWCKWWLINCGPMMLDFMNSPVLESQKPITSWQISGLCEYLTSGHSFSKLSIWGTSSSVDFFTTSAVVSELYPMKHEWTLQFSKYCLQKKCCQMQHKALCLRWHGITQNNPVAGSHLI